ncbi:hypothetical protein ACFVRU_01510 [Streptomyces sp. NPDC057927]
MKTRIVFTGTLTVYTDEAPTVDDAEEWVETALLWGDKHASDYVTTVDTVVSVARVGDDE